MPRPTSPRPRTTFRPRPTTARRTIRAAISRVPGTRARSRATPHRRARTTATRAAGARATAASRVTERRPGSSRNAGRRIVGCAALLAAGVAAFATPAVAGNAALRASVDSWSNRIGVDAHSVALAAQRRHPRRMTSSAARFRRDALAARAAIRRQSPSTTSGRHARALALAAFTAYAKAGALWASSGRARLAHHISAATSDARAAARYARSGNGMLLGAGRLLR